MPFGAVPVSPFGETPGPRGTPFGATTVGVTGEPLGDTSGPREAIGDALGVIFAPVSPDGEIPEP